MRSVIITYKVTWHLSPKQINAAVSTAKTLICKIADIIGNICGAEWNDRSVSMSEWSWWLLLACLWWDGVCVGGGVWQYAAVEVRLPYVYSWIYLTARATVFNICCHIPRLCSQLWGGRVWSCANLLRWSVCWFYFLFVHVFYVYHACERILPLINTFLIAFSPCSSLLISFYVSSSVWLSLAMAAEFMALWFEWRGQKRTHLHTLSVEIGHILPAVRWAVSFSSLWSSRSHTGLVCHVLLVLFLLECSFTLSFCSMVSLLCIVPLSCIA